MRIGIIGMGWVGSSVAISLLQKGITRELLLYDRRPGIAEGEAMDLMHGAALLPLSSIAVRAVPPEQMLDCEAIVVTAGRGGKPGETRLDLLRENLLIAREIAQRLQGFKGLLVVVSNPVDVLTYFYQKFTGLPSQRVIGTGTFLDTVRLRQIIGARLRIDPRSVHAQVLGEHGDSEVTLWSSAMIGSSPLRQWPGWQKAWEAEISEKVRRAAYEIISRKGATNHAIGLVTATLLRWLLKGERRVLSLSTVQPPQSRWGDCALSLPCLISPQGVVEERPPFNLSEEEAAALERSGQILAQAIAQASGPG